MQKIFRHFAIPAMSLLVAMAAGCTLYPEKKPPTLASTTSAEHHERILWEMVGKQQWTKVSPLFASNLVWSADGKSLNSDQVVPYLQSLHWKDAVLRDATFKPNGPDMTVTYTLQASTVGGGLETFSAFSVWQQLQGGGYVLIAHGQQAQTATSTIATSTMAASTPVAGR